MGHAFPLTELSLQPAVVSRSTSSDLHRLKGVLWLKHTWQSLPWRHRDLTEYIWHECVLSSPLQLLLHIVIYIYASKLYLSSHLAPPHLWTLRLLNSHLTLHCTEPAKQRLACHQNAQTLVSLLLPQWIHTGRQHFGFVLFMYISV